VGGKDSGSIAVFLIFIILLGVFLAGGYYILPKTKYAAELAKIPVIGQYFSPVKDDQKVKETKEAQFLAQEGRLKIQERELEKKTAALEEKKILLEQREMDITKKEAQLNADNLKNDNNQVGQSTGDTSSNNKLKRLAKIYAGMEAKKVAAIMKDLDDNSVIIILSQIKPDQAGEIISSLDPQQAAKITKLMMQPVTE